MFVGMQSVCQELQLLPLLFIISSRFSEDTVHFYANINYFHGEIDQSSLVLGLRRVKMKNYKAEQLSVKALL